MTSGREQSHAKKATRSDGGGLPFVSLLEIMPEKSSADLRYAMDKTNVVIDELLGCGRTLEEIQSIT
ncbi:hypothetical protein CEXT_742771 [Caerostris extrusa]|uniref:Uncharacterized protein n=1 Tax=Caerostris extrusa TaxID=172846 RepID=A0AAV4T9J5_CAEEX|nr:hypothetical protein CEXT_742771 [Caerostris extrusa]